MLTPVTVTRFQTGLFSRNDRLALEGRVSCLSGRMTTLVANMGIGFGGLPGMIHRDPFILFGAVA